MLMLEWRDWEKLDLKGLDIEGWKIGNNDELFLYFCIFVKILDILNKKIIVIILLGSMLILKRSKHNTLDKLFFFLIFYYFDNLLTLPPPGLILFINFQKQYFLVFLAINFDYLFHLFYYWHVPGLKYKPKCLMWFNTRINDQEYNLIHRIERKRLQVDFTFDSW